VPLRIGVERSRIPVERSETANERSRLQAGLLAFAVNALDYLLKPIDPARLAGALARVSTRAGAPDEDLRDASPPRPDAPLQQLFVRDVDECWFVPLRGGAIAGFRGQLHPITVCKRRPLMGRSLAALEARLDPRQSFRANRRQILNLDFIVRIELGQNGRLHVELREGREVGISRRQSRLFKALSGS
jgi:two-component system, LytTR family, response regulator